MSNYMISRTAKCITVVDPIGLTFVFEMANTSVFLKAAEIFDAIRTGELTIDEAGEQLVQLYPVNTSSFLEKVFAQAKYVKEEVVQDRIKLFEQHDVKTNMQEQTITFRGEVLPNDSSLYALMLAAMLNDTDSSESLNKFLEKLLKNNLSVEQITQVCNFMLGKQIETNRYNINEDGDLLLFRSARDSGELVLDSHSNTIPQIVGATYIMPYKFVDTDPNNTCSYGLHVATEKYAKGFASVLFTVSVNPRDILSVPIDYNFEKVRCTRYKIESVVTEGMEHKTSVEHLNEVKGMKHPHDLVIFVGRDGLDHISQLSASEVDNETDN